jgi:hypothetical protein
MACQTRRQQYADLSENPHGYCPNHATGVKLPDDFVVTPLQYVELTSAANLRSRIRALMAANEDGE